MRKKALVISAIAVTTLLAGGWALAQSVGQGPMGFGQPFMCGQGPGGMGPGMMKGHGMMKGMGPGMMHGAGSALADPTQFDALKAELEITPAQEQAWSTYAKAVQDSATTMETAREGVDPGAVSKMTPADRYAFVSKMRERGQKRFDAVRSAANELLAALDATQKAKAADILPGLAFDPRAMHGPFAGNQQHKH